MVLEEIASDSPAPGGGTVSALGGALSAALSSMVYRLTLKKSNDLRLEMGPALDRCMAMCEELLDLASEDAAAFDRVMDAFRLPNRTPEEKAVRIQVIQKELKSACTVPFSTAKLCLEAITLGMAALEKGSPTACTDAAVGILCASTGLKGALFNVVVNLKSIHDEAYVSKMREEVCRIWRNGEDLLNQVFPLIDKHLGTKFYSG
jgi:formiminotetrahydrofolate cyclodeaminase